MKKGSFALPVLIIALLASATVHAQSAPGLSAYQFSDGVHPTFDATFEDARERDVASFWRNELKSISVKVTNKKELIGAAARIPAASPDTMRILIAVDRPKGGLYTTAHIAFLSTAGYVGPDTPERELNGCTQWVQQREAESPGMHRYVTRRTPPAPKEFPPIHQSHRWLRNPPRPGQPVW